MLKTSPAVTVTGVPGAYQNTVNNYILFPDSEDKNLYYALAEQPTFQSDSKGNPNFNLTWYFGSGVESAGICTMTVGLPMPDTSNPAIMDKIAAALTTDKTTRSIAQKTLELCQAMEANDTPKVAALKAVLGFNDDAADKSRAIYNKAQGWEQFLPQSGNLDIRPIPFKSGSVTVQAFADPNAYQQQKADFTTGSIQTTPSLINSNAAVVTFNLKDLGANLFWHALGGWQLDPGSKRPEGWDAATGGSSIITATYQVTFDGLLPEAKATVTLDQSIVAKLNVEWEYYRGSWGLIYRREVPRGKKYEDLINSATQIVLPWVVSDKDKDDTRKLLTDWAAKQLESMAESQLPGVKLEDLNVATLREMSQVKKQSRTYVLTQAVALSKYPQAQLPKLDGIVEEGAIKKFFQLINLNDVPYVKVNMTVRPPSVSYLKDRLVDRFVVTQVRYAGEKLLGPDNREVSSIEYMTSAPQTQSQTLTGTFSRNSADKSVEYSYLVAYTDGTPSFRGSSKQVDNNYLDLGGLDIGVLSVSLDSVDLPWDVINSAKVELQYKDPEASIEWSTTMALRKDGKMFLAKPFGTPMGKPLTYKVTLIPTTGAPIVGESVSVDLIRGQAEITLKNPLGNMVNPISFNLDNGVVKAQLRVEYTFKSAGPDRVFNQVVQLDNSSTPTFVWNVPSQSDKPSLIRVIKARVFTSGGQKDFDTKELEGGVLPTVDQETCITVQADGISTF